MKTAILFPGQGSQQLRMLHDLVRHPAVDETLSEVSAVLDLDVRTLDTPEGLQSAVSVQLAILTAGVATARALQRRGFAPLAVAGLSVGAFSAAVAADSISLSDAVRLVRSRAEQMEQMYPVGYGLSAIVGLTEAQVAKLVDAVNTKEHPVFVGNINAPRRRSSFTGSSQSRTAGCTGSFPLFSAAACCRLSSQPASVDLRERSEADLPRQRRCTSCAERSGSRQRSRRQYSSWGSLARCDHSCM
jgi:hypothetical protein